MSAYQQAREKLSQALREIYPLICGEADDDDEEFQINRPEGFIQRWVLYFETTAPLLVETENGKEHSYAKGLYVISDDGTGEMSMQDWEIIGMTAYARDNEIFG
jgi:hypothetical protein